MKTNKINALIAEARKEVLNICTRFEDYHGLGVLNRAFSLFEKYPDKRFLVLKSLHKVIKTSIEDDNERKEIELVMDFLHIQLDIPCAD